CPAASTIISTTCMNGILYASSPGVSAQFSGAARRQPLGAVLREPCDGGFRARPQTATEMGLKEELEASFKPAVAEVLAERTRTAPYPSLLGFTVAEQRPGFVRCALPVTEKLYSGIRLMHGGAMISVIDHVLSIVVYPHIEVGQWAATLDLKINYIAPVMSGE